MVQILHDTVVVYHMKYLIIQKISCMRSTSFVVRRDALCIRWLALFIVFYKLHIRGLRPRNGRGMLNTESSRHSP